MTQPINFEINPKETLYFGVKIIFSIIIYGAFFFLLYSLLTSDNLSFTAYFPLLFYTTIILVYLFFRFGIFIGHLKGNSVKVSPNQFADINTIVVKQSTLLGLSKIPDVYIYQSGGILNAYATRFAGSNYIILFSELVESAFEKDKRLLEFVIGHELGHIKQQHMLKKLILLPSSLIPLLGFAYSRACEYTCDNIGRALSPEGGREGLLLLISGRNLYSRLDIPAYIHQGKSEFGFWYWFSEVVSSHPHVTKRITKFREPLQSKIQIDNTISEIKPTEDYSKYMPRTSTV